MSSRKELAGVRIDICSQREAVYKIEQYMETDGLHAVELISMKTVVTAGNDENVRRCLEDLELVLPSDKEILEELGVTSRKWLEEAKDRRVLYEAMRSIVKEKHSVYLLTQNREQMEQLCQYLEETFGELPCICGNTVWEEAEGDCELIINDINAVAPHLLLVLLPTPDQEKFLLDNRNMLNVRLWLGIGCEHPLGDVRRKPGGVCRRLLAHRKMKRQIQNYGAETKED